MPVTPDTRLLRKILPGTMWGGTLETPYIQLVGPQSGRTWEIYVNDNAITYLVYRTYYDITGWSKEQLSAFVAGVGWQETDRWTVNEAATVTPGAFGPELQSWDIVSKSEIPNTALDSDAWGDGNGYFCWNAPGMPLSNFNLEEVFAGRARQWVPDSNMNNIMHQTMETLWGAGDATAGDRIYITRIIAPFLITSLVPGSESTGFVPPQAVIVPAVLQEEPDLQYIERLRRSYVNAGSRTL